MKKPTYWYAGFVHKFHNVEVFQNCARMKFLVVKKFSIARGAKVAQGSILLASPNNLFEEISNFYISKLSYGFQVLHEVVAIKIIQTTKESV